MIEKSVLLRIALSYNTVMSRAMLRALGADIKEPVHYGIIARVDKYDGIAECFSQRHGIRQ